MEFNCRVGNCKCQGTEVNDIKEDGMVREHVKRILISLRGWCSFTPWSQNSKGWWESGRVGECDLRASRSGTDRDGFTVAQAWNCFSFPLELSWKCLRLQTISKQQLSQSPRARTMRAQRQVRKTLNYLEQAEIRWWKISKNQPRSSKLLHQQKNANLTIP